ncbi:histidine phosphatase family protein [Rosistilla oblonga]|uniref:Phosphoserine phosphatase 1 n=1 Tax=Rosistilla oblonga TaxID=2527990 RepID=A0A518J0L7_9BACT|nr:histidine phosphatase family protein [Rosistilla oblonga]QDV58879.1 Phosphoserine phosphatase 1 [Rosistilla oblonga]
MQRFAQHPLPQIFVARHGETEWSRNRQHTGLTDIDLTDRGVHDAQRLGRRLENLTPDAVFTSPLRRASATCRFAGYSEMAVVDPDLVEWDYGQYEGKTTREIQQQRPGWNLFSDGCPAGETLDEVADRARRVIQRIRAIDGNVLIFSHGHMLNVLAACWIELEPRFGERFFLDPATVSILGYHHDRDDPVIRMWNSGGNEE